jgi:hypothetical protein
MQPIAFTLFIVLALTWARLYRPVHRSVEGNTLRIAPLPLLAKIRMHSMPSIIAFALALGLAATGEMPWWMLLLPVVSTILLLAIPVRYTITNAGIRLGWTGFRRWTEFGGVRRTAFGAQLVGMSGHRRMNIWLSGSRDDDEFLHFLRQTLKNAYKGQPTVVSIDGITASASRIDPPGQSIAAFSTTRDV